MIGDIVVVDAVADPYNLAPDNQNHGAKAQLKAVCGAHRMSSDPGNALYTPTQEEFFCDFPYEALARAEFIESLVDLGRPVDICEMGLVEEIEFQESHLRITLCLTGPGCIHLAGTCRFITDERMELEGICWWGSGRP